MPRHRLDGVSVSMLAVACLGMGMRVCDPQDKEGKVQAPEGEAIKEGDIKTRAANGEGIKEGDINKDHDRGRGATTTPEQEKHTKAGLKERQKKERLTDQHRPIHVPRRLTEQIHRRIRNLLHSPPPPARDPLAHALNVLFSGKPLHALRAADGAWRYDVGGYAAGPELQGDAGGEGVHAGFGDDDVGLQGGAGVVHCGGDEDYAAAEGGEGGWGDLSVEVRRRSKVRRK